jgi:predicted O-methyltransferase YrrM
MGIIATAAADDAGKTRAAADWHTSLGGSTFMRWIMLDFNLANRTRRLLTRRFACGAHHVAAGVVLVNLLLSRAGQAPIARATYDGWIDDLTNDAKMSDAYDAARPLLQSIAGAHTPHKVDRYKLDWLGRLAASRAHVDMFYVLVRAFRPKFVIETGVAVGGTTSLILAALSHNGVGELTSIDLPNTGAMSDRDLAETGILVPQGYRARWRLIEGDAALVLPDLLETRQPNFFVHDSDHTYAQMMLEYALALRHIAPRSLILSDDISVTRAFWDFAEGTGCFAIAHQLNEAFGAIVTP